MNNLDQQRKRDPKLVLPDSHSHSAVGSGGLALLDYG